MVKNIDKILSELEYHSKNGIVDLTKKDQVDKLQELLKRSGVSNSKEISEKVAVYFLQLQEKQEYDAKRQKELENLLKQKIKNPKTGEDIQISTALGYGKTHPAYKPAMARLASKNFSSKDIEIVDAEPEDEEKPKPKTTNVFGKTGKGASVFSEPEKKKEKNQKSKKEINWTKVESDARVESEKLYGKNNKGRLLQNSTTSDAALQNGYTEGEWWVAPGNAGSNFNENMSNEATSILKVNPNLDEETLARVIFNKTKGTVLASQQANPVIKSKNKIQVPPDFSKEDQILYKNCVIAARSGKAKYDRAATGAAACKQQVGFGEVSSVTGYGGTSKKESTPKEVETDRDNMISEVNSANNCYIYDDETGKVYKVPKDYLTTWIKSSGGGENAADTVVLTKDINGNLLYDGWSDKKTLADLQANGTLYNDMVQSGLRVDEMIKGGQIKDADATKSRQIIDDGANEIKLIEKGYSTISSNHSKYHLSLPENDFKKLEETAANNSDTKKHYKKWKENVDAVAAGQGKSTAKNVTIAEEICGVKRKKSKDELAADQFIEDVLDKYEEDDVATLLKNPDLDGNTKKQILKAIDAGKKGRDEYMKWFNNEWLADKKNKASIKSLSSFRILNNVQIKMPSVVSDNERKIIDRVAVSERERLKSSGQKMPKTLDTQAALESMRKQAFDAQRGIFEKLSKIPARTMSGDTTTAAAALGFRDVVSALHLDKIELPKDDGDFHQILKRSTNLTMEGIRVSPKTIRECLGVTNLKDLEKNFVVDFSTDKFIKNEQGFITGKTIAIYLVDKEGKRREISPKVFRPKQGPQAKTANTLAWSEEMQECFDSKNNT